MLYFQIIWWYTKISGCSKIDLVDKIPYYYSITYYHQILNLVLSSYQSLSSVHLLPSDPQFNIIFISIIITSSPNIIGSPIYYHLQSSYQSLSPVHVLSSDQQFSIIFISIFISTPINIRSLYIRSLIISKKTFSVKINFMFTSSINHLNLFVIRKK